MSPTADIAVLEHDLAAVGRETARLLLQPEHDACELKTLEIRAAALRARITAAYERTRKAEPMELRRSHGAPLTSGG